MLGVHRSGADGWQICLHCLAWQANRSERASRSSDLAKTWVSNPEGCAAIARAIATARAVLLRASHLLLAKLLLCSLVHRMLAQHAGTAHRLLRLSASNLNRPLLAENCTWDQW